jgi:hypothetical protein
MEPALEETEPAAFPEPNVWPTWKPFTRGEYALQYDPSATTESVDTESSTSRPPPARESGR